MPTSKTRRFNYWWLIFGVVAIITALAAIIVNINVTDNSANKITGTIDADNGDLKINWDRYPSYDVNLAATGSLTITEAGTYHITGSLENGEIKLDIANTVVKLILDNVNIKNPNGPAIYCVDGEDLVVELIGENYLEDGSEYLATYDEDIKSAIYSKADLTFQGDGTLNITANYEDGIVSKDDLKFNAGTYRIIAADDGVRGKDSVYIVNGSFEIESGADAIKTTNEVDLGKGFILVENGTFSIQSTGKALKATSSILIYRGKFSINSRDDAIHSNNYVGIIGGDITVSSGDDGIHADRELIIDGGTINIAKAYEGLEAQVITINDGEISLATIDDGINAGGGADNSSVNRPGANAFNADENCTLTINGGNIYVNAGGDGIDSNGYLTFAGGKVVVDGPTNNGNGALDAGIKIIISGGEIIAVGSSGMAESLGSESGVCNISVFFSETKPANTKITIKDSSGNIVLEHTAAKIFSHLAAGSEELIPGETYTIYVDDVEYQTFTISNVTTTIGSPNTNHNMMPRR